jgi:PA domain-containing protein/LVIVD repeat-containing protein
MRIFRLAVFAGLVAATALTLAVAAPAAPVDDAVSTFTYTKNMHPLGYSPRVVPFTGPTSGIFNSDLAFWGKRAYQGTYEGFRIIDVSDPTNPVEVVNFTGCVEGTTTGNQGDVLVWGNILVRSWNSPTPTGGRFCGGILTPAGQEGVHVFDISDPTHPVALAFVATPCGSHTETAVPDPANDRLLIYSSASSNAVGCRGLDIIQVPLANPAAASYLRFEPSGNPTAPQPNLVTIDAPSPAAGTYNASDAAFGPAPPHEGISGAVVLVNDGSAAPSQGCNALVGFPAGAIALVDRGGCTFLVKAQVAQAAGAVALVVANNAPGDPITMGGDDPGHAITIPAVMVSQADGATIKAGLPATGKVSAAEIPENPERACHDTSVILGNVMKAACAGHDGYTVWSLDPAHGGSLENPQLMYSMMIHGVTIGHTAAFTWDGKYFVFGHEPGGGGEARCQATSAEIDRTLFFIDAETGEIAGTILHPRPQTATENCTWHNLNVVPTDKRYVFVSGNYQSGISVVDFTDPANAHEIAYADPAPLNATSLVLGGDWSTYWYNGHIYESDIRRGLIIWKLSDSAVAGARKLDHLNPQTLETSFPRKGK